MTSGAGRTLTYDYDNMPVSITYGATTATSVYDAGGQRVKKTVNGSSTTTYVGKGYECTDGNCTKYIFAASNRIAKIDSSDTYYYHTDHLGSSSVMTGSDGSIAQELYYYPYGEIKDNDHSDVAKHKFTGQEWDSEYGLYYYGARYYDPRLARFVSADPVVPIRVNEGTFTNIGDIYSLDELAQLKAENNEGNSSSNISSDIVELYYQEFGEPQKLNRYAYVENNPVNLMDPLGLAQYYVNFNVKAYSGVVLPYGVTKVEGTVYSTHRNQDGTYDAINFKGRFQGVSLGFSPITKTFNNGMYFEDNYDTPNLLRIGGEARFISGSAAFFGFGVSSGGYRFGDISYNVPINMLEPPLNAVGFDLGIDFMLNGETWTEGPAYKVYEGVFPNYDIIDNFSDY